VRITALCMGSSRIEAVFNVDADSDGQILRSNVYNGVPSLPSEPGELRIFTDRLIKSFL